MKYYRSIEEFPIWNFNKVNDTGDYRYLLKAEDYFDLPKTKDKELVILGETYELMLEQLFIRFGFDEAFISGLREEKAILILKLKIIAGERSLQAVVDIKEHQIGERTAANKAYKIDFDKKVAILQAHFKLPFDIYKMSVVSFYSFVSLFSEHVKRSSANSKPVK